MSDDEIKAAVDAEYRKKYPDLIKADVMHIARGLLPGEVVVVDCEQKTDHGPPGAGPTTEAWEEMCYVTEDGTVKIFNDTKALIEGLLMAGRERESIQSLESQRSALQNRKTGVRWAQVLAILAGVVCLTATLYLAVSEAKRTLVWAFAIYSAFNFVFALLAGMLIRDAESDFQEVEYKIDLQIFKADDREKRAEKILRLNDLQLRRYYESSLRQNGWVFWLGIFCIMLGVGISGLTLWLVAWPHGWKLDLGEQVVVAAIGAVGSLLTNYVAVIYLKMNASVSGAMVTLHERLVATHQTLFGNLVASRIADDKLRWDTLSKIALNISKPDFRTGDQEFVQKS
jgi:hypothetical protein